MKGFNKTTFGAIMLTLLGISAVPYVNNSRFPEENKNSYNSLGNRLALNFVGKAGKTLDKSIKKDISTIGNFNTNNSLEKEVGFGCYMSEREILNRTEEMFDFMGIDFLKESEQKLPEIVYADKNTPLEPKTIAIYKEGKIIFNPNPQEPEPLTPLEKCSYIVHEEVHHIQSLRGNGFEETKEAERQAREIQLSFLEKYSPMSKKGVFGMEDNIKFRNKEKGAATESNLKTREDLEKKFTHSGNCLAWENNVSFNPDNLKRIDKPMRYSCKYHQKRDYAFTGSRVIPKNHLADANVLGEAINSTLEANVRFDFYVPEEISGVSDKKNTGFVFGHNFRIPEYDFVLNSKNGSKSTEVSYSTPINIRQLNLNQTGFVFKDKFFLPIAKANISKEQESSARFSQEVSIDSIPLEKIVDDPKNNLSVYKLPDSLCRKYCNEGFNISDGVYNSGQSVFWVSLGSGGSKIYNEGTISKVDKNSGEILINYPIDSSIYSGPVFDKNRNSFIGMVESYHGNLMINPIDSFRKYITNSSENLENKLASRNLPQK